jgi:hypothetical protein
MPKLFVVIQARRRCGDSSSSSIAEESNDLAIPLGKGREGTFFAIVKNSQERAIRIKQAMPPAANRKRRKLSL